MREMVLPPSQYLLGSVCSFGFLLGILSGSLLLRLFVSFPWPTDRTNELVLSLRELTV